MYSIFRIISATAVVLVTSMFPVASIDQLPSVKTDEQTMSAPVSRNLPLSASSTRNISVVPATVTQTNQSIAPIRLTVSSPILESHLIIPKIGVDATIKSEGLTSTGAMAVPDNNVDVGWYSLGTKPGQTGSAVFGAHNYWKGPGVFIHLDQLAIGDTMSVVDADGTARSFVVRDMVTYDRTDDATNVFQSSSGAHLNLITCSGDWDQSAGTYTKRLIVFADLI